VRFLLRFAGIVAGSLVLAAALLAFVKPVADLFSGGQPYDIGEWFRRLAELLAISGGIGLWMRSRAAVGAPEGATELGRASWLVFGFLVGATSFTLLLLVEVRGGVFHVEPSAARLWTGRVASSLASAVLLAVFEETILRDFLLQSLRRKTNLTTAVGVTSVFYATCHYFVAHVTVAPGFDALVGWRVLAAHARAAADASHLMPLVGLALAGAALCAARVLSGTLACAIGLHVGWLFLFKTGRLVVKPFPLALWLYGPHGVAGRPETWLGLVAVAGVLALPRLRPREVLESLRT